MRKGNLVKLFLGLVLAAIMAAVPNSLAMAAQKTPTIEINVGINWIPPVKNDGIFDKLRAEASGVYTTWSYTQGDEATARRLKLAGGSLPDVWAAVGPNGDAEADLVSARAVIPIEKYLNMPGKYPNLARIPKIVKEYVKNADGHTYFIPTFIRLDGQKELSKEGFWYWGQFGFWVRTDVLAEVGMKKSDLATMDDFVNFLRKSKELKDPQGNPMIPLTIGEKFRGYRAVAAAFGVDTFNEASGFYPDGKGGFMAARDNPQYKKVWAFLNKLYREGLLDKEAPTAKKETTLQKISTGRAAAYIGQMTDLATGPWAAAKDMDDVSTKFEAIAFPKVAGVEKIAAAEGSSPFPWVGAYIMKGANVEASLKYLDWALGSDIMTVKFGPPGKGPKYAWNWSSDKKTWSFNPEVVADLTSGDANREQKYGAQPWWFGNLSVDDVVTNKSSWDKIPFQLNRKNGRFLKEQGISRDNHNFDSVPVKKGGIVEKYAPALNDVEDEYRAKFLIAKNDEEFEATWQDYRADLEKKGKWSEYKKEWLEQYEQWKVKMNY